MILRDNINREIASVEYALEHSNWNQEEVSVRDILRARLVILSDLKHNTITLDNAVGWRW
jgi:hypothetical protein